MSVVVLVVIYLTRCIMTASPVRSGYGSLWRLKARVEEAHKKWVRQRWTVWGASVIYRGKMVNITRPYVQTALHVLILAGNLSCTRLKRNGVCACLRNNLEKMLKYWTFRVMIIPNPGQRLMLGMWLKHVNTTGFWQAWQSLRMQQFFSFATTGHIFPNRKLPSFSWGTGMQPTIWKEGAGIVWPETSSGEASKLNQQISPPTEAALLLLTTIIWPRGHACLE